MTSRPLLASLLAALGLLAACTRPIDERIIGTWKLPDTTVEATFRPDHTFTIAAGKYGSTGTWRVEGNQLTTIVPTAPPPGELIDTYTIKVSGDEFVSYGTQSSVGRVGGQQIGETQSYTLIRPIIYKRVK